MLAIASASGKHARAHTRTHTHTHIHTHTHTHTHTLTHSHTHTHTRAPLPAQGYLKITGATPGMGEDRQGGLQDAVDTVEFDPLPLVSDLPIKVLDSSKVTLAALDAPKEERYMFSADLPAACKVLYDNVAGRINHTAKVCMLCRGKIRAIGRQARPWCNACLSSLLHASATHAAGSTPTSWALQLCIGVQLHLLLTAVCAVGADVVLDEKLAKAISHSIVTEGLTLNTILEGKARANSAPPPASLATGVALLRLMAAADDSRKGGHYDVKKPHRGCHQPILCTPTSLILGASGAYLSTICMPPLNPGAAGQGLWLPADYAGARRRGRPGHPICPRDLAGAHCRETESARLQSSR
jgi:hypothetical protein